MIYFAQTMAQTPATNQKIRVRNLRHKTSILTYHQGWTGFPNTPEKTINYPYQLIIKGWETSSPYVYFLWCSQSKICRLGNYLGNEQQPSGATAPTLKLFGFDGTSWINIPSFTNWGGSSYQQANSNVYTNSSFSSVQFTKTTTIEQDTQNETSVSSEIRARGVWWKDEYGNSKRVNL